MLVSSTTRPLLGCVWNFPSALSGLAYATTSMIIHETIPIILMALTNLGSLYTLYMHGRVRSSEQNAPVIKRVPAERRAAKVRKREPGVCALVEDEYKCDLKLSEWAFLCEEIKHLICFCNIFIGDISHPVLPFFVLFPPGDSGSHHALHYILGHQHDLCQLFQLQPWFLGWVSFDHCSFCQHYLHCHVTGRPGNWTPAAAFFHQVCTALTAAAQQFTLLQQWRRKTPHTTLLIWNCHEASLTLHQQHI